MKTNSDGLYASINRLVGHTFVFLLMLISIFVINYIIHSFLGSDSRLFDFIPLRYIFDFADLLAIARYLYTVISDFRSHDKGSNNVTTVATEVKSSDAEVTNRRKVRSQLTVVESLAAYKSKRIAIASLALAIPILVYPVLARWLDYELNIGIYAILLLMVLALFINYKSLTYRISKGLYGTNEHEAREIIEYIIENSYKEDSTDDHGLSQLFPQPSKVEGVGTILGVDIGEVEG